VRKRFKISTSWFPALFVTFSQGKILDKTWEEIGNRCSNAALHLCLPGLHCFTVSDRRRARMKSRRVRIWDSCALGASRAMAGGHNRAKASA